MARYMQGLLGGRVKGIWGGDAPSRATIASSSSGVEYERMEMAAWSFRRKWERIDDMAGGSEGW